MINSNNGCLKDLHGQNFKDMEIMQCLIKLIRNFVISSLNE